MTTGAISHVRRQQVQTGFEAMSLAAHRGPSLTGRRRVPFRDLRSSFLCTQTRGVQT
jgi:hypothetical protein